MNELNYFKRFRIINYVLLNRDNSREKFEYKNHQFILIFLYIL